MPYVDLSASVHRHRPRGGNAGSSQDVNKLPASVGGFLLPQQPEAPALWLPVPTGNVLAAPVSVGFAKCFLDLVHDCACGRILGAALERSLKFETEVPKEFVFFFHDPRERHSR